jgi:hypothetical protein
LNVKLNLRYSYIIVILLRELLRLEKAFLLLLLELDLVSGPVFSQLRLVEVVVYVLFSLGLATAVAAEDTGALGAAVIRSASEECALFVKFGLKSAIFYFSNLIFLFLFLHLIKF